MAYIRRIRIANYRSIKSLDVDLTPPEGDDKPFRHLILTGPNGSGKTSALERIANTLFRTGSDSEGISLLDFDEETRNAFSRVRDGEVLLAYFPAKRALTVTSVKGPTKIAWGDDFTRVRSSAAHLVAQYLVNRKTEQAFALAEGDQAAASSLDGWFLSLETHLRQLFEEQDLKILFDRRNFSLTLRYSDGREVTFEQLAAGHSAVLDIFFDLLLRTETQRERLSPTVTAQGIVLIDEVETHLHLRLQELILPFLTELFPTLQFIVATHSPAVIASIPDAVVYDLGSREQVASEELRGIRYGTLVTSHFGVESDMDHDSTEKLRRLRALSHKIDRSPPEQQELDNLAVLLQARSATLGLEVWKALNPAPGTRAQDKAS